MKIIRMLCGLYLLLVGLLVISQPATVLAQDGSLPPEEIKVTATNTKLEGTSGDSFKFEAKMNYHGTEDRVFDLTATGPKDWSLYITPSYPEDKKIRDIRLAAGTEYGESILVHVFPPYWIAPEPGEYKITLEASSGEIKGSIELVALVTAKYTLSLVPSTERYNTTATAGKDNYFSVELVNDGSAAIDNIVFSSTKPEGWTIDFSPKEVNILEGGKSKTLEVNIKPPDKTIAGDYVVSLRATGSQATAVNIEVRVTVETPTVWGWAGVGIILVVIVGLGFVMMRFSRR